jgi:hypothetical protein
MVTFGANTAAVDDSHEGRTVVGFVQEDKESGVAYHYLTLQRTHEFDDQDARLGQADVYLELDGHDRSNYGGILRFALHRTRAHVSLDETAARKLGVDAIDIRLDADPFHFQRLRDGLRKVFQGFHCFVDESAGAHP